MLKRTSTKHALITSVIGLVLCISMLIGSTYAWFTDSVTSSNNIIQAGNLQVSFDLLEKDGSWSNINQTGRPIFDYDNWEPGCTQMKILRICNNGSLAFQWVAVLKSQNELSELGNVIDVYVKSDIAEYPNTADELSSWQNLGTLSEFISSTSRFSGGTLEKGEIDYFGIAFRMREDAENYYQNMELGVFDIAVMATQLASEFDSFGNGYDSAAGFDEQICFESLSAAFDAIHNGTLENTAGCSSSVASVAVETIGNNFVVTLLKSITVTESLTVTSPMELVLNGNVMAFENTELGLSVNLPNEGKLLIDGTANGSAITLNGSDAAATTAIEVLSGDCEINGGVYSSYSVDSGSKNSSNPCIKVTENGNLKISNATVTATDLDKGTPNAIYIGEGCYADISDCILTASAPYGLNVNALYSLGNVTVSESEMKGYSNYTANAAGTDYASHSRGIYNGGDMTLLNSYVIGTHSGMTSVGTLRVSGGIYEGYGHGGIYFAGSDTTSYIKDATVRYCDMPDGYYDDGVAGTNSAGMYIGGGSSKTNIAVYADNCIFSAPKQSIVIRGTSGEQNDVLYISNSEIDTAAKIRIDANNALYIGVGNNFTEEHTRSRTSVKGTVENTDLNYRTIIEDAFNK